FGKNTSTIVNNTLITRNTKAGYNLEGASYNEYGFITFSTITHNGGQGIRNSGHKWMFLRNNIVSFNAGKALESTADVWKETNIFYGNSSGDLLMLLPNNIIADPQYVSATNNDFRLSPNSPAINQGIISSLLTYLFNLLQGPSMSVDLDNNVRP